MLKSPVLSLAAILSLTLGIGANTTVFSFADALFLRLPPVASPHQLVEVYVHDTDPGAPLGGEFPFSYPDYLDYVAQNNSFSGIALYNPATEVNFAVDGNAAAMPGQLVSANYFSMLGVQPAVGRGFAPSEGATPGSGQVVVLSYSAWRDRLGAMTNPVGQVVNMNGIPFTVIGVAPRGFEGLLAGLKVDFWAPVTMAERLGSPGTLESRGSHGLFAVARLKPGVSVAAASAEMDVIQHRLDKANPKTDPQEFGGLAVPVGMIPAPFRSFVGGGTGLLAVVVGLVLLIACVNAALALMVQAMGRRREWAVRSALGASRRQLIRQGLAESLVLAGISAVLGLGLAEILGPLLLRLRPPGFPIAMDFSLNAHVLLFTLFLAIVTGVLFGLAPAAQAARLNLVSGLKEGTQGTGTGRSSAWARNTFVIAEVALCVVVLVGATLCLRSLQHANAINPGFDTHDVVVATVDPESLGYKGDQAEQFMKRAATAVEALPGVRAASYIDQPPLQIGESDTNLLPQGMAPPPGQPGFDVDTARVAPEFFAAMGTRLLAGRDFRADDLTPGRMRVVVVNQKLAEQFWPHQSPLGKVINFPGNTASPSAQVIGVAETGKHRSLGEQPREFIYQLVDMKSPASMVVRVSGDARAFLPTVRRTLQGMDANLTSDNVQTIQDFLQVPLFPAHFTGVLLGGFGILALLLAMLGLYGVMASSVAQRTREFGIRMALGADAAAVSRLVVGQGLRLTLIGVAVGSVLAALLTQLMSALLYGLSPLDPLSYLVAAVVLAAVAALASLLPARRATRVDPKLAISA
ncbi:MAG TPA: ABC transporter permease [Terriglobales bacterium]